MESDLSLFSENLQKEADTWGDRHAYVAMEHNQLPTNY